MALAARILRLIRHPFLAICLAGAFTAPVAYAETTTSFAANDVGFLNLMGNLEAPRGFDTVSDFAPVLPERPLTEMTMAEVLDYQRQIRAQGTISSAVGRYQFIYLTLRDLVERHGISETLVFDAEVQTYLARFLMHNCGFYERDTPVLQLGNCLANVWAALPLVSGPSRGASAYAADGINKAFVAPDRVIDVLARRFEW
ncbi:MAG: hypothetical protein JJU08_15895 [Rhodobacteraceae bacterium]|nr:hypothetical protein [Paracoccaceae bacterium]